MLIRLLYPLVLGALALAVGCGGKSSPETPPTPDAGMVHLRYQFQDTDMRKMPQAFNVYRADSRLGPFEKLNAEPIAVMQEPSPGAVQLLMTDKDVTLGETYAYYIEGVFSSRQTQKLTSVTEAMITLPLIEGESSDKDRQTSRPGDQSGEKNVDEERDDP